MFPPLRRRRFTAALKLFFLSLVYVTAVYFLAEVLTAIVDYYDVGKHQGKNFMEVTFFTVVKIQLHFQYLGMYIEDITLRKRLTF